MNKTVFFLLFILSVLHIQAQDIQLTRNGQISFFSTTPVEDIRAVNNEVSSVLNTKTGTIQFVVLMKSFQFKKAAMQEHFNKENYMNSDLYPKSEFKGTVADLSKVDFKKDGTYPVNVEGNLTMHGVTNKVRIPGSISIKNGKISATSKFNIKLADYKITVPAFVSAKVAESVEVSVNCNYETYQPKS